MPRVSSKRQITLPVDQCRKADINPGDEYVSFVDNLGHITIIKKISGAASGLLKDIKIDKRLSDESSLHSSLSS
jgi:bifunctional DNA-binding transcriptional regulator/antitoxin component of YhaV-PrlF toxin-antitoxin module